MNECSRNDDSRKDYDDDDDTAHLATTTMPTIATDHCPFVLAALAEHFLVNDRHDEVVTMEPING